MLLLIKYYSGLTGIILYEPLTKVFDCILSTWLRLAQLNETSQKDCMKSVIITHL